jgi:AmmeMemoRadiSam system protein B
MDVRPSPIAGLWYPAEAGALRESVGRYLAEAPAAADAPAAGRVLGLVAPHAGHRYSGAVAASAFAAVRGAAYDLVALLCPSHFHADGPLLTSAHEAYATPLGAVRVDRAALERLRAALAAEAGGRPEAALPAIRRDREHAIEIELPFLQLALRPGFKLLPLMLRDQDEAMARALGRALARALAGCRALLVASSDLSHYYPQAAANRMDAEMLARIGALDPAGVLAAQEAGRGQACGAGAIAAVLWAAQALGADRARVVAHATSGDVNEDYAQVVGYGAAVILQSTWKEGEPVNSGA